MSIPLRVVEDDYVDRLQVEVQQCMKLSSTNYPIASFFSSLYWIYASGSKSKKRIANYKMGYRITLPNSALNELDRFISSLSCQLRLIME